MYDIYISYFYWIHNSRLRCGNVYGATCLRQNTRSLARFTQILYFVLLSNKQNLSNTLLANRTKTAHSENDYY